MQVRDQLLQLVRLQEIVLETRSAHDVVEGAPTRIEEIEQRFRERNSEYVAVKQRFDALEEDQRMRSDELKELEQHHEKYKADLMQVQNQREYAAMLREIDSIKSRIAEHEEAILKDMEEIEGAKTELASQEEHIKTERELVETERAEVDTTMTEARGVIEKLVGERSGIESGLPAPLISSVKRLEAGRQGQFLSKADDGVCQSCFVRIRPQVFQEIKLAQKIHYCSNCRRLLYHEPNLLRAEKPTVEGDVAKKGSDSVETVNGGAV